MALDDDGAVLAVGAARELRAAFPTRPRSAPRARCCPAWSTRTRHLELSALAGAVPGGDGPGRPG